MISPDSKTDWEHVWQMQHSDTPIPYDGPEDGPYDPNDDAAVDAFWDSATITHGTGKRGPQVAPKKELISLRLSKEVLDYFRSTGPGWQTRINQTLKRAVRRKRSAA